jgi:hypothetical protein
MHLIVAQHRSRLDGARDRGVSDARGARDIHWRLTALVPLACFLALVTGKVMPPCARSAPWRGLAPSPVRALMSSRSNAGRRGGPGVSVRSVV